MGKGFLRQETVRFLRLGKNRRKLQRWRRPRGPHSKMRRKRFGYPISPSIGFRKPKSFSGKIEGKTPVLVHNMSELSKVSPKTHSVIIARIGAKKKIELLKHAQEKGISVINMRRERKKQ